MNGRLNPPTYGNLYYSMIQLKTKINSFLQDVADHQKRQKLLDFGCGSKPYKETILSYNFEYLGADLASIEGIDVAISESGILDLEDASVDVVLSSQVLEHIYDFDIYLRECNRVLKPNGQLILSTHGHWQFHPDPNDYWRWTSQGLKMVIERNNFEINRFEGIMNMISVSIQYFQDHFRHKLKLKLLITVFTYITQVLIRINEKISKPPLKDACIFILRATKK